MPPERAAKFWHGVLAELATLADARGGLLFAVRRTESR
jgi:hypothetical protein